MKSKKNILFYLLFISNSIFAQEINCVIKINTPKLQQADPKIFVTLKNDLTEFINNRRWTTETFKPNEKIECSIIITIKEETSQDEFKAQATIQASRPVFNSSYNTTILNFNDVDFNFQYAEYQPLEFLENGNTYELTSLFAFYANLIIAMDFDSYSPESGTPYFTKAQQIIQDAQNSSNKGWRAIDGLRNRYWMVENMLNSKFSKIRTMMYTYHRQGLDKMYDNPDQARKAITSSIDILKKIFDENPNIMIVPFILNAKTDEIINIYTGATANEKPNVVETLSRIDASHAQQYKKILK